MSTKLRLRIPVRRFSTVASGLAVAGVLVAAGAADARNLGSLAPPNFGGCGNCHVFQRDTDTGQPSYVVPKGAWTITSWSAQAGGSAPGKARLRVYRPTGTAGQYMLVKQSKTEKLPKHGHPAFTTNLDVKGGDLLGISTVSNVVAAFTSNGNGGTVATVSCGDEATVGQVIGTGTGCTLGQITDELANIKVIIVKR